MSITVELDEKEQAYIEKIKSHTDIDVSFALKKSLLETLEDIEDSIAADASYKSYLDGGKQSRPIEELWKEIGYDL